MLNFQKLLSLKAADLLFGDAPVITAGRENGKAAKAVEEIMKNGGGESGLVNIAYMAAVDMSRYGDGLFYIYKKDGRPCIDVTQPSIWFPVVNPENLKEITHHVLGWVASGNPQDKRDKRRYRLKVHIHGKGSVETREYEVRPNSMSGAYRIGEMIGKPRIAKTGLSDFAIVQVSNLRTSDRSTGIDDYRDVNSIVYELMVRFSQISKILDKHASPSMQGPGSALEKDPATGEYRLVTGNYFKRDSGDDPTVEYLTWDGQLSAAFDEIKALMNQLYILSEMSPALLGDESNGHGGAISGTALRLRMISPLAKVNRIKMSFTPALKKVVRLASELMRIRGLDDADISIKWQSGLPNDPREEADIMNIRTGGRPTMSVQRALKVYDGMTDQSAEKELADIAGDAGIADP